jgi:hypothetical protein
LDRLPDRRQPERLAGVDGEVEVLPLQIFERVQVAGGRVARLGARDVEADHSDVAVAHGQFGDLLERAACRIAVSRVPTRIGVPAACACAEPSANPARTASTTSGSRRPRSRCCSGAKRTSA